VVTADAGDTSNASIFAPWWTLINYGLAADDAMTVDLTGKVARPLLETANQ
jgi:hypothetical protein